jgi:LPXTG-site transpeptidase (sortase) family protein
LITMQFRSVLRRTVPMLVTGALLAALSGCAGEAGPSALSSPAAPAPLQTEPAQVELAQEPAQVPPAQLEAAPAEPTLVGRSLATPPPPREVDAPTSVELGGVDIAAEVQAVGIDSDGQMELPPDPDEVGWYRFGPTAGDGTGSVVLAGHVDSRKYGLGQLVRLQEAEVGDEVVVRTKAGDVHKYTVTDVRNVPRSELPLDEVFSRDGAERLLLITCGGGYDDNRGYDDNVVVTAEPK